MRGPIDYVVIAFPGNKFKGEIMPELQAVVDKGLIQVDDLLFVTKSKDGDVAALELSETDAETAAAFASVGETIEGLLGEEDIVEIGELLENNSSAAILVFEHLWAKGFKQAVLNADGRLVAEGRIHPDVVAEVDDAIAKEKKKG